MTTSIPVQIIFFKKRHLEIARYFEGDASQRLLVDGGSEGARTLDLRVANAALSQLSYEPMPFSLR